MADDIVHPETGEVLNPQDVAPRPESPGKNLCEAIHKTIATLPVWITQDESAQITDKVKRKYATLKAIMAVVRPKALANGIRIRQGTDHAWALDTGQTKGRMVPVFTELVHTASGETERTTVEIPLTRMDAQAMGSAISYGRRYGLLAAFGLTTDEAEDDGKATKGRDISEDHEESQDLWELKADIRDCETMEALSKFREKAKATGRLDRLSDADFAVAQRAFKDRKAEIEMAQDGKAKK